jgi:hypothetical protein
MNEGDSPTRSRRSSATSTRSRHGSVGGFSPYVVLLYSPAAFAFSSPYPLYSPDGITQHLHVQPTQSQRGHQRGQRRRRRSDSLGASPPHLGPPWCFLPHTGVRSTRLVFSIRHGQRPTLMYTSPSLPTQSTPMSISYAVALGFFAFNPSHPIDPSSTPPSRFSCSSRMSHSRRASIHPLPAPEPPFWPAS